MSIYKSTLIKGMYINIYILNTSIRTTCLKIICALHVTSYMLPAISIGTQRFVNPVL